MIVKDLRTLYVFRGIELEHDVSGYLLHWVYTDVGMRLEKRRFSRDSVYVLMYNQKDKEK